jgi:hypothetical protein
MGIGVWALYGVGASNDNDSHTYLESETISTVQIMGGGVAIGYVVFHTPSSGACTWTNMTKRFDDAIETYTNDGGADTYSATTITPSITADCPDAEGRRGQGPFSVIAWPKG